MRDLTRAELNLILDLLWIDLNPDTIKYETVMKLMEKIMNELLLRDIPYISYEVSEVNE